jgi:hypothetical protein
MHNALLNYTRCDPGLYKDKFKADKWCRLQVPNTTRRGFPETAGNHMLFFSYAAISLKYDHNGSTDPERSSEESQSQWDTSWDIMWMSASLVAILARQMEVGYDQCDFVAPKSPQWCTSLVFLELYGNLYLPCTGVRDISGASASNISWKAGTRYDPVRTNTFKRAKSALPLWLGWDVLAPHVWACGWQLPCTTNSTTSPHAWRWTFLIHSHALLGFWNKFFGIFFS